MKIITLVCGNDIGIEINLTAKEKDLKSVVGLLVKKGTVIKSNFANPPNVEEINSEKEEITDDANKMKKLAELVNYFYGLTSLANLKFNFEKDHKSLTIEIPPKNNF